MADEPFRILKSMAKERLGGLLQSAADSLGSGPTALVEDVCRAFYDDQLLTRLDGTDAAGAFFDAVWESMARADRDFADEVDEDAFRMELTAIRFELFGLALTRRAGWRREDLCLKELVTTRAYLERRGELRLWEAIYVYNREIAEVGVRLVPDEVGRGRVLNQHRIRLAQRYGANVPRDCLEHYVNRYYAGDAWSSGQAMLGLMQALSERLGYRVNGDAQMRLHILFNTFHDEAERRWKAVRPV